MCLPQKEMHTGTELAVWNHDDTQVCRMGLMIDPDVKTKYNGILIGEKNRVLIDKITALRDLYHRFLSPAILVEEYFLDKYLLKKHVSEQKLPGLFRNFLFTLYHNPGELKEIYTNKLLYLFLDIWGQHT